MIVSPPYELYLGRSPRLRRMRGSRSRSEARRSASTAIAEAGEREPPAGGRGLSTHGSFPIGLISDWARFQSGSILIAFLPKDLPN